MGRYVRAAGKGRIPSQHWAIDCVPLVGNGKRRVDYTDVACMTGWRYEGGKVTRTVMKENLDPHDLWDTIAFRANSRRRTVVWAYRASYVTALMGLIELIDNGSYVVDMVCDIDPPFILRGRLYGKRVDIWDTRNWLPEVRVNSRASVQNVLGETATTVLMGLRDEPDHVSRCYAVAELAQNICRIVRDRQLGSLRPTIASQAMQWYRAKTGFRIGRKNVVSLSAWPAAFDKKQRVLPLVHDNVHVRSLEREAMAGGIVRCPAAGSTRENVHVFDVVGLYRSVMRSCPVPAKFLGFEPNVSIGDIRKCPRDQQIMARVRLASPTVPYPICRGNHRLYACGHFWTTLSHPELVDAVRRGVVQEVSEAYRYQAEYLFRLHAVCSEAMAADAYGSKTPVDRVIAKGLNNTLWSKWAQHGERWSDCRTPDNAPHWGRFTTIDADRKTTDTYRAIGGKCWHLDGVDNAPEAMPVVSATVASAARLRMRALYEMVGYSRLYYTCVDSLHTDAQGAAILERANMIDPLRTGHLRSVGTAKVGTYYAPGWYELDGVLTAAGLPATAELESPGHWKADLPATARYQLTVGPQGGCPVETMRTVRPKAYVRHAAGLDPVSGIWPTLDLPGGPDDDAELLLKASKQELPFPD